MCYLEKIFGKVVHVNNTGQAISLHVSLAQTHFKGEAYMFMGTYKKNNGLKSKRRGLLVWNDILG